VRLAAWGYTFAAMAKGIGARIIGIFRTWWRHKWSLTISVVVTLAALAIYYVTFLGEQRLPLSEFVKRLELDSIDVRFQLRGRLQPDPRIIIVDIDQHSQEVLGRWPFPRINFAKLVDALHEDGARVVSFDITFSRPDGTAEPLQSLSADLAQQQKQGKALGSGVLGTIQSKEKEYDYDQQFADSIQRFGSVVLGDYFLYTQADLTGVSNESLDSYANLMAFFPFPRVQALPSAKNGDAGRLKLIAQYASEGLLPQGAEANTQIISGAIASEKGGAGFFNVWPDPGGVVRRVPMAIPYGRDPDPANWDFYASIDVQTLRLYYKLPDDKTTLYFGDGGVASIEFGPNVTVHPDDVGRLRVNFNGPVRTYPYVSFADVALKKFASGTFKDKIVLVGASATGIGDLRSTPFGSLDFPGVEIHANVLDNILNKKFLEFGGKQALTDVGFILLFGLPLGIWLATVQPKWMVLGLVLLAPFAGIVYWAFLHGWLLNFIVPAGFTLVPNVVLVAMYRVLVEEQEKRKVRGAFQHYVSPEVIRRLLSDPERVKPRKTAVSVLFSDIRGFTTISESLDAQELADLLNGYLTEMTRIVFRNKGTLDKYIGDAVMALWGAPFEEAQHAERACAAALQMLSKLGEMQQEWRARGEPVLEIGIGINTGIASVGNMGSALRYGYTAMGDTVNLSSRLEGLNKEYGTRIIVSEATYLAVHTEKFVMRELDLIRVQGKQLPVTIYEILSAKAANEGGRKLVELFARGREAYKIREWRAAKIAFEEALHHSPQDGPSKIFLARCEEYLVEGPAADWDGVYSMKHK
jgi:adenylate cyclase